MQDLTVLGCSDGWYNACHYLRVISPLRAAGAELRTDTDQLADTIDGVDFVIVTRQLPADEPALFDQIVKLAHQSKKPIVYEIDDLLIDLPIDHPEYFRYSGYKFHYIRALLEADLVIATNDALAAAVREYNQNVFVLPNYLDDSMWKIPSDETIQNKDKKTNPLIIGYMGTKTHTADLESIEPALINVLNAHEDNVRLKLWGMPPVGRLKDHKSVDWISDCPGEYELFVPYFQKQNADIFIAPLKENRFNSCKSFLKYLEYSALGVPGVYSRGGQYEQVVQDGSNGLLAGDLLEWHKQLNALIENPELRKTIGLNALKNVREKWMLSSHLGELKQMLEQCVSKRNNNSPLIISLAKEAARWSDERKESSPSSRSASENALQNSHLSAADLRNLRQWQEMDRMKHRLLSLSAELTATRSHALGLEKYVSEVHRSWVWKVGSMAVIPVRNITGAILKRPRKTES